MKKRTLVGFIIILCGAFQAFAAHSVPVRLCPVIPDASQEDMRAADIDIEDSLMDCLVERKEINWWDDEEDDPWVERAQRFKDERALHGHDYQIQPQLPTLHISIVSRSAHS